MLCDGGAMVGDSRGESSSSSSSLYEDAQSSSSESIVAKRN